MRGYQAIPVLLNRHGLGTVFAMIAETNGPWLGYGTAQGLISMVRTRHEQTAVMAANGFARTTGRPGVASVTRGPGFANALNALAAAVDTHVPLILLTAASPRTDVQSQNLEQEGITRLIGAGHVLVRSATDLTEAVHEAVERTIWAGRPHVISIMDSVLDEEVEPLRLADPLVVSHPLPAPEAAARVADLLSAAQRPLLIGGGGALAADARRPLERLAERTGAALGTSLMAIRMFSGHPNDIGLVGGWAPSAARAYFRTVDAVVAFGAGLNQFTMDRGRLFPGVPIAQVLLDPADAGTFARPDVLVVADAAKAAEAVDAQLARRGVGPREYPGPSFSVVRSSLLGADAGAGAGAGLDVRAVAERIDRMLPADRIVVTDSGRAVIPLPDLVDARDGRSWVHGRGYGSIGQGLGLAIGAATAHPERTVVLFVGDGAFLSSCQDLDAVRLADMHNLVIVVLNDERYGMETRTLREYGLGLESIEQSTPDLVAIARAYGGDGTAVRTAAELDALRLPRGGGFFLVEAQIDAELDPSLTVGIAAVDRDGRTVPSP